MRFVKISMASGTQTTGRKSYKIGLPRDLGDLLYDKEFMYEATLTDDGILFKRVPDNPAPRALPEWAER